MTAQRKRVAAIVTEYRIRSHADNIVTRLLEGYALHWEIVPPRLQVASLYTDQVPANDISRDLAAQHGVPIFPTIREALTLGGNVLAVDGVVLIGEHGDYPFNEKGQRLYPRRRFFEETVAVFRESGRVVPVFSDKHLAYNWEDARWIYDTVTEMGIPFMAGGSAPIGLRVPPIDVPYGAPIEEIVVVANGPIEGYGYHAIEVAQCLAERRRGHETGVAAVQCLTGQPFWEALRAGDTAPLAREHSGAGPARWSPALAAAALGVVPHAPGALLDHYARHFDAAATDRNERQAGQEGQEAAAFLIEYRSGLRLAVLMLNGYVTERGVAVKVSGEREPLAAWFVQSVPQPSWGSCHQVDFIERLVESGQPPYPPERTLLTTGLIDAVMTSRHEGGRRIETPHLALSYQPTAPPPHHERSFLPPGRRRTTP